MKGVWGSRRLVANPCRNLTTEQLADKFDRVSRTVCTVCDNEIGLVSILVNLVRDGGIFFHSLQLGEDGGKVTCHNGKQCINFHFFYSPFCIDVKYIIPQKYEKYNIFQQKNQKDTDCRRLSENVTTFLLKTIHNYDIMYKCQ